MSNGAQHKTGYKEHLRIGLIAYAVILIMGYYLSVSWDRLLLSLPLMMLYTMAPDIDSPSAKIRWWVDVALLILLLLLIYLQRIFPAIMVVLALLFLHFTKHRGVFHSPLTGLVLASPLIMFDPLVGVIAFIGYIVHLIADGMIK